VRRHRADLTSLLAGLVFLAIAVVYLVASQNGTRPDPAWVLALGFLGLGAAGLIGSVWAARRDRRNDRNNHHNGGS
jgi:UDP-N-acetylmuramyl pentapeptide phosphotransferase/UDP-N-acetylglucosamine-1-phosphate transferase